MLKKLIARIRLLIVNSEIKSFLKQRKALQDEYHDAMINNDQCLEYLERKAQAARQALAHAEFEPTVFKLGRY